MMNNRMNMKNTTTLLFALALAGCAGCSTEFVMLDAAASTPSDAAHSDTVTTFAADSPMDDDAGIDTGPDPLFSDDTGSGTVSDDTGSDAGTSPPSPPDAGSDAGTDAWAPPAADTTTIIQLALGDVHSCLLRASGRVSCWGSPGRGTGEPALLDATAIAAVGSMSYALRRDGTAVQWLGSDGPASPIASFPAPTPPVANFGYDEIHNGLRHSCGRLVSTGLVACWGSNRLRQIGRDTGSVVVGIPPTEVLSMGSSLDSTILAVGRDHSCVAVRDGRVLCWGSNSGSPLGRWVPDGMSFEPIEPNSYYVD